MVMLGVKKNKGLCFFLECIHCAYRNKLESFINLPIDCIYRNKKRYWLDESNLSIETKQGTGWMNPIYLLCLRAETNSRKSNNLWICLNYIFPQKTRFSLKIYPDDHLTWMYSLY